MKPYAILILTQLRVAKFDTKDEFKDAIKNLQATDTPFIALKYNNGAELYTQLEIA